MKTKKAVNRSYKVLNLSKKAQDSLHKLLSFLYRSEGWPPSFNEDDVGYMNDLREYLTYRKERSNRVNKAYEASRNDLRPEAEHLANRMVKEKGFDASQQIQKQEYWSQQFMMAMDVLAHERLGVTCSWIEREKKEGRYAGNRN